MLLTRRHHCLISTICSPLKYWLCIYYSYYLRKVLYWLFDKYNISISYSYIIKINCLPLIYQPSTQSFPLTTEGILLVIIRQIETFGYHNNPNSYICQPMIYKPSILSFPLTAFDRHEQHMRPLRALKLLQPIAERSNEFCSTEGYLKSEYDALMSRESLEWEVMITDISSHS